MIYVIPCQHTPNLSSCTNLIIAKNGFKWLYAKLIKLGPFYLFIYLFIYLIHYLISITRSYTTNWHRASIKYDTLKWQNTIEW